MRSPQNVLESLTTKAKKSTYKYERLYRNLYNPQFYLLAYQRIQKNPGNMTPGADHKTLDGMSIARIESLIEKIRDHSYQPTPAKRIYIAKSNGKQRPLGIPSVDDKLIQEVLRLILESIYEPTFSCHSHGFRPNKSCHTALREIQRSFTGTRWWIEGDIKGCFDSIDHHVLIDTLRKRISDECFLDLIWKFLRAGYLEQWTYHNTYSGTPQGSILSPILSNIYLNLLDQYLTKYADQFNCGKSRSANPAYIKAQIAYLTKQRQLEKTKADLSQEQKDRLIAEIKELRRIKLSLSSKNPLDETFKRISFCRYADDFAVGVIGSKRDAEQIKRDIGIFITRSLCMEMSVEKTLITPGYRAARFLGYDLRIHRRGHIKRFKAGQFKRINQDFTKRIGSGNVVLYVPREKWLGRLLSYKALEIEFDKQRGQGEVWKPIHRNCMLNSDDLEIVRQYNAEIRGLYNYYRLASNASVLNKFYHIMKGSMLRTFACKYRAHVSKVASRYREGKDFVVNYSTKDGMGKAVFYNGGFCRNTRVGRVDPDIVARVWTNYSRCSLIKRLLAGRCEVCGIEDVALEVHHVRRLRDLLGRKQWEIRMIARRRKTMVLCVSCHGRLHAGVLD
ncbi:reverse transcriptase domain-containing protein [Candidatus Bathycorpusculum sp.]|uniref:reverse transcriptase domain-containing protein n=1 Tax=Candidatus Bathycorpusculum sp. TaxID=2994959 RepID=UPI00282583AE|nr:reverse transcriptase domain-containing protein [Candidatus Termitimicrobium sp.]